jgi:hypothetical protein
MFLKFEHYDHTINEVSHYGFLREHFIVSKLKDEMVGFKKKAEIK